MLCNIENFITRIPGQVELQQPVYLMDALGKMAPFHLEFVRSAEVEHLELDMIFVLGLRSMFVGFHIRPEDQLQQGRIWSRKDRSRRICDTGI